jgi:hypothetical protein
MLPSPQIELAGGVARLRLGRAFGQEAPERRQGGVALFKKSSFSKLKLRSKVSAVSRSCSMPISPKARRGRRPGSR